MHPKLFSGTWEGNIESGSLKDIVNIEFFKKRTIMLTHDIESEIASMISGLLILLNSESKDPITMVINSCGGEVEGGLLAIYDSMQIIEAPVHTVCIGDASSAAAILLAAGEKGCRFITENSSVMIHQLQVFPASGSMTDVEIEAAASKKLKNKLNKILAIHTGQPLKKVTKDCERDKYMTAQEAVDYGIADFLIDSKSKQKVKKLKK